MTNAPLASVEKIENRYVVTGVIAVIAERRVDEEYSRVFRTRREAEVAAKRLDQQNAEAIEYLAEVRATRLAAVKSYLAARAARGDTGQLSLF